MEKIAAEALIHKIENAFQRMTLAADQWMLILLWLHLPFAAFIIPYGFGTWKEGLFASLLINLIATISYLFSKGTLSHRILNGLLLMCYSITFISIQYGRIEMHFHVFATLPFLLVYKDWKVYPLCGLVIAFQHVFFNYCQSNNITSEFFPIVVFNYGSGWDIVFLHSAFLVIQISVLIYYSKSLEIQYINVMKSNDFLNETVELKTINLRKEIQKREDAEKQLLYKSKKLEDSNRELENFAYVASHDLQEPLRMVSSYLGLFQRKYKDKLDANATEYMHFAVDGAVRMSKMITSLLEYSRVGRQNTDLVSTDLNTVIKNVISSLEVRIKESNAEIKYSSLPTVICNEQLITRLFLNLIGNALKFKQPDVHPIVKIEFQEKVDQWIFAIIDNGIGIPKNEFQNIFEIFKRLHTQDKYEGTGIGLSICKKIVENHSGKIWIESTEGSGTTFFFSIAKKINGDLEK